MTTPIKPNLTVRASLNASIIMLTVFANIGVGLVVNPALVGALGSADFGIWKICQRLLSFVSAAESQSTQGLKWTIAGKQADPDVGAKRRDVGSALIVWIILLPVIAMMGGLVAWFSPSFVNDIEPSQFHAVRVACVILAIGLVLMPLQAVPTAVMTGMNREYQIAWLRPLVLILAGAGMVAAAMAGKGITGVALASIAAPFLVTVVSVVIAKRALPWLGADRPSGKEVKGFFGFSFWILGWAIAARFLFMSDVIVLGLVTSATTVSYFVLSYYPIQMAEIIAFNIITASMPSLGHLISAGDNERAGKVAGEITRMTWLITVIPGVLVLLYCNSFVSLWVGPEKYIGHFELLLMVILCIQAVLIRNSANILNLTLDVKIKFYFGLAGGLFSFGLGYWLGGPMQGGVAGVLIGLITGRLILAVAFPIILRRVFNNPPNIKGPLRMFATSALMLGGAGQLAPMIQIDSWLVLVLAVGVTSLPVIPTVFLLGLSRRERAEIQGRLGTAAGAAMRRLRRI